MSDMMSKQGWGSVATSDWTHFVEAGTGQCKAARLFTGWIVVLNEPDLPMNLVRDSRWAIAVYNSPEDTLPLFLVPGCKVQGIQFFPQAPAVICPGAVLWPKERELLERDAKELGLRLIPAEEKGGGEEITLSHPFTLADVSQRYSRLVGLVRRMKEAWAAAGRTALLQAEADLLAYRLPEP